MKRLNKIKLKDPILLLLILIVGVFLRLWFSDFKVMFPDYDPFYHAKVAEYIYVNNNLPVQDKTQLGGIPYYYPPVFHILITIGRYLFPSLNFIAIGSLLNVFFGMMSIVILYIMVKEHFNKNIALASTFLFSITPMIIFRTGLWARPTGLSIFLVILTVYSFLRLQKNQSIGNVALLFLGLLLYTFSHSSLLFVLPLLWIMTMFNYKKKFFKIFFKLTLLILFFGILYYYTFIPFLNFSLGYTSEYEPLVETSTLPAALDKPRPFEFWAFVATLLFLSTSNFISFPFIMHGIIIFFKGRKYHLVLLTISSILLIFFKNNLFILFIFILGISIVVSLDKISNWHYKLKNSIHIRYGWSLAILLFLFISSLHMYTTNSMQGERINVYIEPIKNVLTDAPLSTDNVVLANDITVGHSIPYYSNASTFMSVLTDTKKWNRNHKVYKKLYDENLSVDEAMNVLMENDIDHLLIINDSNKKIFPFIDYVNLTMVGKTTNNNITIILYELN